MSWRVVRVTAVILEIHQYTDADPETIPPPPALLRQLFVVLDLDQNVIFPVLSILQGPVSCHVTIPLVFRFP